MIVAPNWLGDAVMALPAIADVRRADPRATVAVAARSSIAPLFSLVPGLDDVIVLPRRGTAPLASFDAAVLLPNSFHAAMQVARARVAERWGYRTDLRGVLLTRAIAAPPRGVHQIDRYQHLTRALGFPSGPTTPRLEISAAVRAGGRAARRDAGWDGRAPLVAIAPGAAYGGAKRWPAPAFADLAADLAADGVKTVAIGAAGDRRAADDLVHALRGRTSLLDLVGRTDIPRVAGALVHCRALVANDSGALHLAAALGVHVAGLFGPTDDRLTAPRPSNDEHHVVIATHQTWCRPCGLRECPFDHACMTGVAASDVMGAIRPTL